MNSATKAPVAVPMRAHNSARKDRSGPVQMIENLMFPFRFQDTGFPDLSDLSLVTDAHRAWIAEIEERLSVEAPWSAEPLCCYIRTVVFYGPQSVEFGRCETRLQINDVLRVGDDRWQVWSGSVGWMRGAWRMVWRLKKYDEARRRVV